MRFSQFGTCPLVEHIDSTSALSQLSFSSKYVVPQLMTKEGLVNQEENASKKRGVQEENDGPDKRRKLENLRSNSGSDAGADAESHYIDAQSGLEGLRRRWTELYSQRLPALAKKRDPAQTVWPVQLDHCFARIILDNVVAAAESTQAHTPSEKNIEKLVKKNEVTVQWDTVIAKPAVKNMTAAAFRAAIRLAEDIAAGRADLADLNRRSLDARGKKGPSKERDRARHNVDTVPQDGRTGDSAAAKPLQQGKLVFAGKKAIDKEAISEKAISEKAKSDKAITMPQKMLERIEGDGDLSPFRKRLYSVLLSVPRGRYTTYGALSDFLKSSPRAIGNGMRHNPFAPEVPCHRVLAANGHLGGFKGEPQTGRFADEKRRLLADEGVQFDANGRAIGSVFTNFSIPFSTEEFSSEDTKRVF